MFSKTEGAFRAGGVDSTQWDNGSRGNHSAAFGLNNTASAARSLRPCPVLPTLCRFNRSFNSCFFIASPLMEEGGGVEPLSLTRPHGFQGRPRADPRLTFRPLLLSLSELLVLLLWDQVFYFFRNFFCTKLTFIMVTYTFKNLEYNIE